MDLWQRSSLLPPSASLGSRHDDAAATLGQPRFLHGDPRGSQGGEGQLRQPPPAPPGDLETVAAPWARGPHPPAASRPGWCFPPLGATFLKCTLARWWPDPRPSGKDPPAKWLWHSFPEALAVVPRPSPLSRPPGTPFPSGAASAAAAAQWRGRRPVAAGGAPLNPVAAGGAPLNRRPAPAHRAGLHLGVRE